MSPTHHEIASSYTLWMEYVDPNGLDSEEAFEARPMEERLEFIRACFGPERRDDDSEISFQRW